MGASAYGMVHIRSFTYAREAKGVKIGEPSIKVSMQVVSSD